MCVCVCVGGGGGDILYLGSTFRRAFNPEPKTGSGLNGSELMGPRISSWSLDQTCAHYHETDDHSPQGCQLWDSGWSETLGLGGPSRLLTGVLVAIDFYFGVTFLA